MSGHNYMGHNYVGAVRGQVPGQNYAGHNYIGAVRGQRLSEWSASGSKLKVGGRQGRADSKTSC